MTGARIGSVGRRVKPGAGSQGNSGLAIEARKPYGPLKQQTTSLAEADLPEKLVETRYRSINFSLYGSRGPLVQLVVMTISVRLSLQKCRTNPTACVS